jgi:hypothetical protein
MQIWRFRLLLGQRILGRVDDSGQRRPSYGQLFVLQNDENMVYAASIAAKTDNFLLEKKHQFSTRYKRIIGGKTGICFTDSIVALIAAEMAKRNMTPFIMRKREVSEL